MFLRILFSLLFSVYFIFMTIKSRQDEEEIENLNSIIKTRDSAISKDYEEKSKLKALQSTLSVKYSECILREGSKDAKINKLKDKCGKKCKNIHWLSVDISVR